jgi:hypothetical protein
VFSSDFLLSQFGVVYGFSWYLANYMKVNINKMGVILLIFFMFSKSPEILIVSKTYAYSGTLNVALIITLVQLFRSSCNFWASFKLLFYFNFFHLYNLLLML